MNYLVIDLEMCNVPRDYRSRSYKYANETIQIGAVLLDEEFKRIGTLSQYVHPEHGVIDPFIQNLTGIRNSQVKKAPRIEEALLHMIDWIGDREYKVYAWSGSDRAQLLHEIKAKKICDERILDFVCEARWIDYQDVFVKRFGIERKIGLEEALGRVEIKPEGRLHDRMCKKLVDESNIRGNGHAIYQGIITEVENKINQLCVKNFNEMDTVIEDTVTAKAQSGDIDEMASLFNSVSFRDFVMTGYKQKCAITGNVIQYKSFMNLEAAHIWPRSHKGLYLPSNGIALCRDMHWAFDKGMFTIGDDFKVIVHPDVESDYLQQYNNKSLYIPENAFFRPDINNLHYHQTHIYGLFKTSGSLVKATGYYKNINMAAEDKTPYGSN